MGIQQKQAELHEQAQYLAKLQQKLMESSTQDLKQSWDSQV